MVVAKQRESPPTIKSAVADKSGKRKGLQKKVLWADEVGGQLFLVLRDHNEAVESGAASRNFGRRELSVPFNGQLSQGLRVHDDALNPIATSGRFGPRGHKIPINGYRQRSMPRPAPFVQEEAEVTLAVSSKVNPRDQKLAPLGYHQKGTPKIAADGFRSRGGCRKEGGELFCPLNDSRSYKEVLLRGVPSHTSDSTHRLPLSSHQPSTRAPAPPRVSLPP